MEGLLGGLWELTNEFDEVVSSPVAATEQTNVRYEHKTYRALKWPPITEKKEPRTFGYGDATRKRWCQRRHGPGVVEFQSARRKERKKVSFFRVLSRIYFLAQELCKRRKDGGWMRSMVCFFSRDRTPSSFRREFENSSKPVSFVQWYDTGEPCVVDYALPFVWNSQLSILYKASHRKTNSKQPSLTCHSKVLSGLFFVVSRTYVGVRNVKSIWAVCIRVKNPCAACEGSENTKLIRKEGCFLQSTKCFSHLGTLPIPRWWYYCEERRPIFKKIHSLYSLSLSLVFSI